MRNAFIYFLFIFLIGCVKSNPVPTTPPTPVVTIPNAPTDLKGILSSSNQIDLTWSDASNNEDGFKVERKSGTDAFSLIATLAQNVVTYSDKGFTSGPTFSYRVYSYNTKGNSSNSNEFAVKTEDAEVASLKVGLVANYPFNGNAGDSSGNGYHGTVNGTVTYTANRKNISNAALQLGTGYITSPSNIFQFGRSDKYSISIWFITTGIANNGRIISTENPEGNFRIFDYGNGIIGTQFGGFYISDTITVNNWHHLVVTYNNRTENIFIDGTLKKNVNDTNNEILNYGAPFTIGAKAGPTFDKWNGKVDDIRIYNRVLTLTEITYLFKN